MHTLSRQLAISRRLTPFHSISRHHTPSHANSMSGKVTEWRKRPKKANVKSPRMATKREIEIVDYMSSEIVDYMWCITDRGLHVVHYMMVDYMWCITDGALHVT